MMKPDEAQALKTIGAAMENGGQSGDAMRSPEVLLALEAIGCDIAARPKGAPTFDDIAPSVRDVKRDVTTLILSFDASVARDVEAFVAAEQKCCSTLAFKVRPGDPTVLRIEGTEPEINLMEKWMTPAS